MGRLLSNLNLRLMTIHFIAFWLFAYAFFTLAFLYDYNFLHLSSERMLFLNDKGRFLMDKEFIRQSGNFGLLTAYIISWFISTRRDWHWLNSVLIFLLAFLLYNFGFFGWNKLHSLFQLPGKLFPPNSIWGYLTDGLIMIGIACALFFTRRVIRYIDKGNSAARNKTSAKNKHGAATNSTKTPVTSRR